MAEEGQPPEDLAARLRAAEAETVALRQAFLDHERRTSEQLAEQRAEMAALEQRAAEQLAEQRAETAVLIAQLREEFVRPQQQQPPPPPAPEPARAEGSARTKIETKDGVAPPADYVAGGLLRATMAGDIATVEKWLKSGIDPNAWHELLADWTPLHYAAQLGHVEIIAKLLDHGAEPSPFDKFEQTPLMQAGYWGREEAKELLLAKCGGVSRVPATLIVEEELEATIGHWKTKGHATIICSAPEFSLSGDQVMVALFALCDLYPQQVMFGYDWGGSSTAEKADKDPERLVPECCHSLACSCGVYKSTFMIKGAVDWSDPKSVAGSQWFEKYRTKVMTAIMAEAQRGLRFIEMLAVKGGPVTQLEHRTMPMIIHGAVEDLRSKRVSISLLGDAEQTEIKLFLRVMEYDEFLARFYPDTALSASGMCLIAGAKKTEEDAAAMGPTDVLQLKLPDADSLAVLKTHTYSQLPLSDAGMVLAAEAGKSQGELAAMDEAELSSLELGEADTAAMIERALALKAKVDAYVASGLTLARATVRVNREASAFWAECEAARAAPGAKPPAKELYDAAAERGDRAEVRALLRRGADPDSVHEDWPALVGVAEYGYGEVAEILLQGGASVDKPISRTHGDRTAGYTPLMAAAKWGYPDTIRQLLDAGADHTAKDQDGTTALTMAKAKHMSECAAVLEAWDPRS